MEYPDGAKYIISPDGEAAIHETACFGMVLLSGRMMPTEIAAAYVYSEVVIIGIFGGMPRSRVSACIERFLGIYSNNESWGRG